MLFAFNGHEVGFARCREFCGQMVAMFAQQCMNCMLEAWSK